MNIFILHHFIKLFCGNFSWSRPYLILGPNSITANNIKSYVFIRLQAVSNSLYNSFGTPDDGAVTPIVAPFSKNGYFITHIPPILL